jgi:glycerophosphoryl diester phosphodiesterase
VIKQFYMQDEVILISFHLHYLTHIRNLYPSIHIQYLMKRVNPSMIPFCVEHRFNINADYRHLSQRIIDFCHEHDVLVNTWTVDQISFANELIQYGVDFITTNILE